MDINKSITHKMVHFNGFRFKNPMYVCEKFELYDVFHQNIGNLMCQVLPVENSVQHLYHQGGNTIETRYQNGDYFAEPIFIYRDSSWEYIFFRKFITFGQVLAERIILQAPDEREEEIGASRPYMPTKAQFEKLTSASEVCDLYERSTRKSIFSMLFSYQVSMLISRFCFNSRLHQDQLKLQNFDIHRYCFLADQTIKKGIRSGLYIFDRTNTVCGRQYLFERKKTLIKFATELYKLVSPTFNIELRDLRFEKNQNLQQTLVVLKKNYQKKKGGLLGRMLDYVHPWLSTMTGFFIHKVINSETIINQRYLCLMVWFRFFQTEGFGEHYQENKTLRQALFNHMKFGLTSGNLFGLVDANAEEEYRTYIQNRLPAIPVPNRDNQVFTSVANQIRDEDMMVYARDFAETDYSQFLKRMQKSTRQADVWDRLG